MLASVDVVAYVAASKLFFVSLVRNAADGSAAQRSVQLGFDSIKKATGAMNGTLRLHVMYEKSGVS